MILNKPIYVVFSPYNVQIMTDEKRARKMVKDGQLEDAYNGFEPSKWWLLEIKNEDIDKEI